MTRGVITCNLNKRKGKPSVNAESLGYYTSGDEVEITGVVLGETKNDYYEGTPTWYQLTNGIFIWSGGVSLNLEEEIFRKKLELDSKIKRARTSEESLIVYNAEKHWWIFNYGIDKLWSQGLNGKGVKIAVIDTGLDLPHPDLVLHRNQLVDFSESETGIKDHIGHGTHTFGMIASTNNGFGVTGVAHGSDFYFAKASSDLWGYKSSYLAKSIAWAIEQSVDIISISLGDQEENNELTRMIKTAIDKNILVVCAAGNRKSSETDLVVPARYWKELKFISVGGLEENEDTLRDTINAKNTSIFAPGGEILSTHLNGQYKKMSGSSQAAPFVAGVAAIILQASRNLSRNSNPLEIGDLLLKTANKSPFGKIISPLETLKKLRNES